MRLPVRRVGFLQSAERLYQYTRQFVDLCLLPMDSLSDCISFFVHCRTSPFVSRATRASYELVCLSHTVEKGLSLPEPRPLFGIDNISRILHLLRVSDPAGVRRIGVQMAIGSLTEYVNFHQELGVSHPVLCEIRSEVASAAARHEVPGEGGTKNVAEVIAGLKDRAFEYPEFLASRYSCRSFNGVPVSRDLLEKILTTAQSAPSQCNRQSTLVHSYDEKNKITELLKVQGGGRGFAENAGTLLVVSNDLGSWISRGQRSQCYVDAVLFAMALLYSCHAHGVGACALNFAKTSRVERVFKARGNIPSNERVVMLIAIGFPSEKRLVAARSVRSCLDQWVRYH